MPNLNPAEVIAAATKLFSIDDPPSENPDPSTLEACSFYLTKTDNIRLDLLALKLDISRQDLLRRAIDAIFVAHGYPTTDRVDV